MNHVIMVNQGIIMVSYGVFNQVQAADANKSQPLTLGSVHASAVSLAS